MEVDERPTEQYGDIGGLDKQIEEVSMIHLLNKKRSSLECLLFFVSEKSKWKFVR